MGRGYGLRKINEGIMKGDALTDYNQVKTICESLNLPVIQPKGKTAWKIEDATAEMLKTLPNNQKLQLVKGIDYYYSI